MRLKNTFDKRAKKTKSTKQSIVSPISSTVEKPKKML